jgi:hypothetical protein
MTVSVSVPGLAVGALISLPDHCGARERRIANRVPLGYVETSPGAG